MVGRRRSSGPGEIFSDKDNIFDKDKDNVLDKYMDNILDKIKDNFLNLTVGHRPHLKQKSNLYVFQGKLEVEDLHPWTPTHSKPGDLVMVVV